MPQFGEILQIVRAAQGFFPPEDVRTGPLDQARDLDRFAEWSGSPQVEHQPSAWTRRGANLLQHVHILPRWHPTAPGPMFPRCPNLTDS
ncbi:MAG: hypothetical protein VX656_01290 [Candidatus Latescibacterota bacterium]|nr:hypothetical protein [Candidatus Latescibacterota bacterium]